MARAYLAPPLLLPRVAIASGRARAGSQSARARQRASARARPRRKARPRAQADSFGSRDDAEHESLEYVIDDINACARPASRPRAHARARARALGGSKSLALCAACGDVCSRRTGASCSTCTKRSSSPSSACSSRSRPRGGAHACLRPRRTCARLASGGGRETCACGNLRAERREPAAWRAAVCTPLPLTANSPRAQVLRRQPPRGRPDTAVL